MLNGRLLPMVYVRDVERSVAFYRDRLGFEFRGWWDSARNAYLPEWPHAERPEFAEVRAGDLVLHFHLWQGDGEPRAGDSIFHLEVRDVDRYYEQVRSRGASAEPPRDQPWGWRQFYLTDPDGHRWSFRNPTTAGIA